MGATDTITTATRGEPDQPDQPVLTRLLNDRVRTGTSSVIRDLLQLVDRPGMLSMAGGLPAPELLPAERIAAAAARALTGQGARVLQYGPTEGLPELRELVAREHGASSEQVLVTTGSQQALDLLTRSLLGPGDTVVVEAPGYLGALQAFQQSGADLVAVPGDRDGMQIDRLASRLKDGLRPTLLYVVTDFQNPSGATLSLERRVELARLAERHDFLVVEDDPYGALRFEGSPLPRLATLTDHAVSLGTASKTVAPGLRVGWLVAPRWLIGPVVRLKQVADLHTSTLDQALVTDLLGDDAFLAGHLARLRATYRRRADALVGALRRLEGAPLAVEAPTGGMFCWARRTDGRSTDDTLSAALEAGVAYVPGSAFSVDGGHRDHLRLCFTTLAEPELEVAVQRLAGVLSARSAPGSAGRC